MTDVITIMKQQIISVRKFARAKELTFRWSSADFRDHTADVYCLMSELQKVLPKLCVIIPSPVS